MIARRLMSSVIGGGSFAPPLGNGILTAGTISTITDDTYYNAWPVICRAANNNLIVGYTKGFTHHGDNSGNAVCKISTNDGVTWGSEVPIYSDVATPRFSSIMGLAVISTGRIFATLWRDTWNVAGTGQAGIVYSNDNGVTWSAWYSLTSAFAQESFGAGPVIELTAGGNLLVTVEGTAAGAYANRSSKTLKSTDSGLTWGTAVTVRDYVTDTRPYYESKLVKLATGDLLCIHRCAANAPGTHYISKSTDSGATWGAPVAQFAGVGAPSTIQRSNGTLVSVTRRNSDSAAIAYTSIDNGVTWSGSYLLDASMFEMEYGCPIAVSGNRILIVYGYQPTSATNNSDIKQIYVTEGTA